MRGYFLISAFALLCGCSAPSQNLKPGVPANLAQEAFVTLDPAGKDVPATMFKSGEELLKEVEKLGGARGEYETDSVFYERISKLGNFSVGGVVFPSQIKFDPATGEFTLKVSMHDAQGFGFKSNLDFMQASKTIYPSFILGEDVYSGAKYSGQNSFGASALITKRKINRYYLVFNPVPKVSRNIMFFDIVTKLNITAAEMESQRDNIRVLFTVKATPNYLQVTNNYQQPTISNPYESAINNYFFSAKLFWIKVVNIKTGKVYSEEAKVRVKAL